LADHKVKQYGARIRLLDAGLVQQAHQVGEQSPAAAKVAGDEEGDEAAADIPAERAAEFVVRIEQFVAQALDYARKMGRTSDEYKDGLVYEERKRVLAEFIKAAQGWKRCSRCQAYVGLFSLDRSQQTMS
jgi:DNA-directed RNA polymerase I subunit RPA1